MVAREMSKFSSTVGGVLLCTLMATAWILVPTTQVGAETPIGSCMDTRSVVAFRVEQTELQSWLPAPWQVSPYAKGPLKEANLLVVFVDRLLNLDVEGKPVAGGTFRAAALAVPAKHPQTEESAPFIIRAFTPHEDVNLYNPYKNTVKTAIRREQKMKSADLGPGTGSELWELRDSSGEMLQFQMEYQRAVPSRAKQELKPRSAVIPTFYRIYRVEQLTDLVKSIPAGVDRVQNFQFRVTMSELRKLFDGSEQVVGILVIPWYVRQLSLP